LVSHIGWMLRSYSSGDPDFSAARFGARSPGAVPALLLPAAALAMNVGLPLLLGWANGDILGMLLLAGVLRLVISHHVTFSSIRSRISGLAALHG